MTFKEWRDRKRIYKVIKPLRIYEYHKKYTNQIDYMLDWMDSVGFKVMDISHENEMADILAVNVIGNRKDTNNAYCISIFFEPNVEISEEQIITFKSESDACRAIPVFILANHLDYSHGVIAHGLGIQSITLRQIEALNSLLKMNKLPKIEQSRSQFICKLAYYMQKRLEDCGLSD